MLDCFPYRRGFLGIGAEKFGNILGKSELSYTDLVVREAIQNSLDAASSDFEENYVSVNFQTGEFERDSFQNVFEKGDADFSKIPTERNRFLAIRDQYTCGLDGDYWDKQSNFYKLIYGYNTGKGDDDIGNGGSFGLGKTVFCKVGIGFVIYYSRYKKGDSFEERLVIFYCPTSDYTPFRDGLLPEQIGWWGRNVEDTDSEKKFAPLTDHEQIKEILSIFDVAPYEDKATGTTVIIPFTDEKKQLEYVKNKDTDPQPVWTGDLRSYLEYAILKWYAPRIQSASSESEVPYPYGKKLHCSFRIDGNDSVIDTDGSLYKFFTKIRQMYSAAHDNSIDFDKKIYWDPEATSDEIKKIDIKFNDSPKNGIWWQNHSVGTLILRKVNNPDADWSDLIEKDSSVVMLYCRQPGMIVRYSTNDAWAGALSPICGKDSKIIGLFVVNSQGEMTYSHDGKTSLTRIDALFRNIEEPDHHSWKPDAKPEFRNVKLDIKIADRVINRIKSLLQDYAPKGNDVSEKAKSISSILGQFFAANNPEGNKEKEPGKGPAKPRIAKTKIDFTTPEYCKEDGDIVVKVPCQISILPEKNIIALELDVIAEHKKYSLKKWKENFEGEEFPIKFKGFENVSDKGFSWQAPENSQIEITLPKENRVLKGLKLVYSLKRRDISCIIRKVEK